MVVVNISLRIRKAGIRGFLRIGSHRTEDNDAIGFTYLMGATVAWKEILIAIWFFAASLEILLLYLFQIFDALRLRLSRGRGRVGRMVALIGTRLVLYGLLIPFLLPTFSLHRVKFTSRLPPPEMGLTFEDVRFPARGESRMNLAGWFFSVGE